LAIGHTFGETTAHIFNYWIYIPVVALLGAVKGGIIMASLSFLTCYFFILFYDWSQVDWLGIELLKEANYGPDFLEQMRKKSKIAAVLWWPFHQIFRLVRWAHGKGGPAAFFVLSMYTDPFTTTVFLRREKFGGLGKRDWTIFVGSIIFGNFYWTLRTVVIVLIAKLGFKALF